MKNLLMFFALGILLLWPNVIPAAPTAAEIIRKVDENRLFHTERFGYHDNHQRKKELIKKFNGFGEKDGEKSFIVFTNPQDNGGQISEGRTGIVDLFSRCRRHPKISGHMLKQGMMGRRHLL